MSVESNDVYMCERCFSVATDPGACPRCGLPRRHCDLGAAADTSRRPPTDAEGRLLSRAPLWWVLPGAPYLRRPPAAKGPVRN